ncbi:hypothetical protein AVL62_15875 [Serinicoccus chungangensis]|uniref:PNPLA domain-containing protein n=1 Tax=Serinicoccus chungangensis TaxID=767452 RepID=A0A0W8IAR5_9MICO|nr:hypothetical protein [Serinicoccus chungangensis]KUG57065.1 hypothetical protein AVL62_15875 [Serinicoccus chungangensis]
MDPTTLPRRTLILLTVCGALLISLTEIDRLIRMVQAGPEGFSLGLAQVSSPRLPLPPPGSASQPWLAIHQLGMGGDPAAQAQADLLVGLWLGVDVAFAITYGLLLWSLLSRVVDRGAVLPQAPVRLLTWPRPWVVWVAVAADVAENVLLALLVLGPASEAPPAFLVPATAWTSALKWVLLLAVAVQLGYALLGTPAGRTWLSRRGRAVYAQRFSALAFAPVALLALVPGSGILDQLPDIQRTWFATGDGRTAVPGWVHALLASVLLLLVTLGLVLLGRLIADNVARRVVDARDLAPRPAPALRQWLFGPVVVVVLWGGAGLAGTAEVRWGWTLAFVAVPALIVAGSWVTTRRAPTLVSPPPSIYDAATAAQVRRVGDILALSGLVVGTLALIRSHLVLTVLGEGTPFQRCVPLLALAGAILVWWLGPWALDRLQGLPGVGDLFTPGAGTSTVVGEDEIGPWGRPTQPGSRRLWWLAWGLIWVSTAVVVALAVWPVGLSALLGVIGVVMLGLGALMLLVGASVVLHHFYAPPQLFWWPALRLREAPVALLLTAAVVAALVPGSSHQVHGIRGSLAGQLPGAVARPAPLSDAVSAWWARTEDCVVETPQGPARPMILVAAEGGGIRAAYWSAAALHQIGLNNPCGLDAVLLASGVSGGSVGLAVSRFAEDQADAVDEVWAMGAPDALAQASLGLLIRDPAYAVTGLPAGSDAPGEGWHDRAALMEMAWEQSSPGLAADFLEPPLDRPPGQLSAALVLNSTAASSGCRVLVSQVDLGPGPVSDCADLGSPLAYSRDFYADYLPPSPAAGAGTAPDGTETCVGSVPASTASMASARFPYVTPSGVVGPCGDAPQAQLIDGGYAEGSGLGTVVDLAPRLLAEVAEQDPSARVVPIVVYLDNGRGSDLVQPPPEPVAEVLVPLVGNGSAALTQKDTPALLQRARELTGAVSPDVPTVYVVTQASRPAVEAPLGWVLSPASREDMLDSLGEGVDDAVTQCRRSVEPTDAPVEGRPARYPGLAELLVALDGCERLRR